MANCPFCNTRIPFLDGIPLSDGKCCVSRWSFAADFPTKIEGNSRNYSIYEISTAIEWKKAYNNAHNRIQSFHKKACESIGIPHNLLKLGGFSGTMFLYGISKNTLYLIESQAEHLLRHNLMTNINTLKEANALIPLDVKHLLIPIEKIQYFMKEGDIQYTTKISGGGSSGSSTGSPWNIGFFSFFFLFSEWLGHKYPTLSLSVHPKSCPWGKGLCY